MGTFLAEFSPHILLKIVVLLCMKEALKATLAWSLEETTLSKRANANYEWAFPNHSTALVTRSTKLAPLTSNILPDFIFKGNFEKYENKTQDDTRIDEFRLKDVLKQQMSWRNAAYAALYCVGLSGLLGVMAVYALLPELRRPVNAKALLSHVAALAVALVLLLAGICMPLYVEDHVACAALTFSAQYFLLAAFSWLSVLCLEIIRGFRHVLPIYHSKSAAHRFSCYSLFGWCGPVVIVGISVWLYNAPDLPHWVQRPVIGKDRCWFSGARASFAYYYGPVSLLQIANLTMFTYIMVRLRIILRETASLKTENSKCSGGRLRHRKERALLCVKLFLLMGVTWLLEVVTRAAGTCMHAEIVIDSVNVLRGVGVFVACCCKRTVFNALKQRLNGVLRCCPAQPLPMSEAQLSATSTVTVLFAPRSKAKV